MEGGPSPIPEHRGLLQTRGQGPFPSFLLGRPGPGACALASPGGRAGPVVAGGWGAAPLWNSRAPAAICLAFSRKVPMFGLEAIWRNGQVVGHIRRADFGFFIDKTLAYGYIRDPSGGPVSPAPHLCRGEPGSSLGATLAPLCHTYPCSTWAGVPGVTAHGAASLGWERFLCFLSGRI